MNALVMFAVVIGVLAVFGCGWTTRGWWNRQADKYKNGGRA